MRRISLILLLILTACQVLAPTPAATPVESEAAATRLPPSATAAARQTAPGTIAPAASPSATRDNTPTAEQPTPTAQAGFTVRVHPDGPLYTGDRVSFEVLAPEGLDLTDKQVQVHLAGSEEASLAQGKFGRFGIGGRAQATMFWAWDTSGLPSGAHNLIFAVEPDGPRWTETLELLPHGQVPPPEPQAAWASASTDCCRVFYITGTAAERDLAELLAMVEAQAKDASRRMGVALEEPVGITFLPRVLGHGGFARGEIDVSYLDRNYAGGDAAVIIHHEIIHILDARLGGELRPSALVEGLAVYQTGGHFKLEPLEARAAALLPPEPGCSPWQPGVPADVSPAEGCGLDRFIPLVRLFDNFYFEQHEIGYLQAGALIEFMVDTWGWPAYSAFYRDIHNPEQTPTPQMGAHALATDSALRKHFGLGLTELEQRFRAALQTENLSPENVEDVRLTVAFYDAVRLYQQTLDPSAHFLTAWLPDDEQMRQEQIVADYLRRPGLPENLALEAMLGAADEALQAGDFERVEELLTAVNRVLKAYPRDGLRAFDSHPLAADYLAIIQAAQEAGYQPQKVRVQAGGAQVWASRAGTELLELIFRRGQNGWQFSLGAASRPGHGGPLKVSRVLPGKGIEGGRHPGFHLAQQHGIAVALPGSQSQF